MDHHVHTYGGEHEEDGADGCQGPVAVADGHAGDAQSEHGPDHDQERLAHPEGQQPDEETEHPVITTESWACRQWRTL
ncbi:hypothetical protein [Streptomyces sp. NPDC057386]|uniref:hypothetical protein n=1 Tax=unclassified Streptomyces TaxID=2593676 RepID=UPI00362C5C63